jgi:hypothetical protein
MLISAAAISALLTWAGMGLLSDDPAQRGSGEQASQINQADDEASPAIKAQSVAPNMKGSTSVAGYKITLEGVGKLGDISERVTRFRPKINLQSASQGSTNFTSDQFATGQAFNNGNGNGNIAGGATGGAGATTAGGGGGGFTSSGGTGFGYAFTKPTYGIALKITEEADKGKRDKNRYAQLGSAVKIVELDGTV